jgi:hypothetical protein
MPRATCSRKGSSPNASAVCNLGTADVIDALA